MTTIFRGNFKGFGLEHDRRFTDTDIDRRHRIPLLRSDSLPPPYWSGIGGGLAFDVVTKRVYYSDGVTWLPINPAGVGGTVESYAFIKDGIQNIAGGSTAVITNWEVSSSPVYHTIPGWDLITGVYTATSAEDLTLYVNISWDKGYSNLGDRTIIVEYKQFGIPGWTMVKEATTQADPKTNVETTQEFQIHVQLAAGDCIRITATNDAPVIVPIAAGVHTSISGFKVNL